MGARAQQWTVTSNELVCSNPPFANCHASTLVETGNGDLLFSWFGGSHEGHKEVSIWVSRWHRGRYSPPVKVVEGMVNDTLRYPTWNPVLFREKRGDIYLFYKVGPNPREWWGRYLRSDNDGKSWKASVALPEGILGPIKNKPLQLEDGYILFPSSTEAMDGRWHAHIEKANRQLNWFQKIPVDSGSVLDVIQPSIVTHGDDSLQVLCRSKQGAVVSAWSADKGKTWSRLEKTDLLNPNSGTDAISLHGGGYMIVYNPDLPGRDWWEGRAKLRVAVSADGRQWNDVAVLENREKGEYSYPSIIQTRDHRVHITYTDNRKNIRHVVLTGQP